MTEWSRKLIDSSGYDRAGFAEGYDRHRPRPPDVLLETLCRYARVERPALVVDLGCGTGLSTRAWSGRADRIVGVEPNPAMLASAAEAPGVEYREAFAQATGLEDGVADIVTCSQSLHWMDPQPTFAEAARVLRPGGVFAAYDYDWPPVIDPEVDEAYDAYQWRRGEMRRNRGIQRGGDRWEKSGHLRAHAGERALPLLPRAPVPLDRGGECRPGRRLRLQPRPAGRGRRPGAREGAARGRAGGGGPAGSSAPGPCPSSSAIACAPACAEDPTLPRRRGRRKRPQLPPGVPRDPWRHVIRRRRTCLCRLRNASTTRLT